MKGTRGLGTRRARSIVSSGALALGLAGCSGGASSEPTAPDAASDATDAVVDASSEAVTRIYATVVSHNEQDTNTYCKDGPNNDPAKYASNRALLKRLADGIVARGAAFDQQNEWTFLSRVADAGYETDALKALTGGKNIVAYVAGLDARRVSVDVHHHTIGVAGENHADVAGRLEQLGVVERGVVGGFLFVPAQNAEIDQLQGYARSGLVSTKTWGAGAKTWTPKILWGGDSPNHTADSEASGVWRPKSNTAFYTNDPAAPLPFVAHYKGTVDFTGLDDLVAKYQAGALAKGHMYTATVMVNQCEMTDASVDGVLAEIDKHKAAADAGYLRWKTLPDVVADWQGTYASVPQQYNTP